MKKLAFVVTALLLLTLLSSCGTQSDIVIHTDTRVQTSATESTELPNVSGEDRLSVVINKSSKVFHLDRDCIYASRMSEENRLEIEVMDIEYLTEHGYTACGKCSAEYKQNDPEESK